MALIVGFWGVRYQVTDVHRSVGFYTQTLGFHLDMQNLPAFGQVSAEAGLRFRNEMEVGPGGKQIQIEDPDGNPIELFEPARR
jgi:glyoxylase I family protein